MTNVLFVGNKNYSSWSLRAWLCLRWAGIPFQERLIQLDQPGYGEQRIAQVLHASPNGRVPCLHADDLVVWDSLAIAEWVAEQRTKEDAWPADARQRAEARSITAEMHSGFSALRQNLPMNILRRCAAQPWDKATQSDIARIDSIWTTLRTRAEALGPWLFGTRSIADAFYAPVATRMRTYSVRLSPLSQNYCKTVLTDADFKDWESASVPNSWDRPGYPVIDGMYRS
jgi:glutathione S-transferase